MHDKEFFDGHIFCSSRKQCDAGLYIKSDSPEDAAKQYFSIQSKKPAYCPPVVWTVNVNTGERECFNVN